MSKTFQSPSKWRAGAALTLFTLLAACNSDKEIDPPAELVDIEQQLRISTAWSQSLGGDSERLRLAIRPYVLGDRVYSASYGGDVVAMSSDRGKRLWSTKTKAEISAGPAANEAVVLVGTSDGEVIALESGSGKELWRKLLTSEVLAAPLLTDELAFVRTVDGAVHALSLSDGRSVWAYEDTVPRLTLRGTAPPVLAGDTLLVALDNGKVVALDSRSGDVLWDTLVNVPRGRTELERLADIDAPVRVIGDDVFVVGFQGRIAMLALDSGQIWWARDASSYRGFTMDDEVIYLTNSESVVMAMRRNDGTVLWEQAALRQRSLTAPAMDGSNVVVGDFEGYLHWLDRATGNIVARQKSGGDRITNAPVSVEDRLFVQTDDGKLVVLKTQPKNPPAQS